MRKIDQLLEHYGESHTHPTNKLIHWICIPTIMFSLFGLLYAIPFPLGKSAIANWGVFALAFALIYYARLSLSLYFGFLAIGVGILIGNATIFTALGNNAVSMVLCSLVIFVIAWIFQFIGHKMEGKKPSFLEDVQYLLIGPSWLLHFILKKVGIPY
jgi:uncharacterized membrane protein YGL010W